MSIRVEKISEMIKEEISLIFLYKLQDPARKQPTIHTFQQDTVLHIL